MNAKPRGDGSGLPAEVPPAPNPRLHGPRSLAELNEDADRLLRKLIRLRQNLAEMRRDFRGIESTGHLIEANEQLLLAALHAENVAESAVSTIGELAHANQHDALTGIPNRMLALDRLESAIASARRRESRIGVLFIDIDSFKQINDTLGHGAGDEVLQLVARRLQSAVRDSDTVGRYGGEEFLVVLPDLSRAADAAAIARKLLDAIAAPCRIADRRLDLSASIGITVYPEDGEETPVLVSRADAAMYRSKRNGRGGFEFFADKLSMHRADGSGTP